MQSDRYLSNYLGIRQNFHRESEKLINQQINMELQGFYFYLSNETYFSRHDVALFGFAKMFKEFKEEEMKHAQIFIDYQNKRGGTVLFEILGQEP